MGKRNKKGGTATYQHTPLPMQTWLTGHINFLLIKIADFPSKRICLKINMSFCLTSVSDEIGCKGTTFLRYEQKKVYFSSL